jgi:hypothetical protein
MATKGPLARRLRSYSLGYHFFAGPLAPVIKIGTSVAANLRIRVKYLAHGLAGADHLLGALALLGLKKLIIIFSVKIQGALALLTNHRTMILDGLAAISTLLNL